ncbi:MAG: glycine/sarcosine/betaine reductase selenoprotein B family protein [Dehalococcoidia bacterium]|jgi:D-proline reductase (dithiol) PrdB|nr:glycine/sarcosine/betaine reductase selenoprotein B family protein [Dehalococcoidia bacterium]MDP7160026.1 glycine/sarcosine/betaine reductase selenoprotein B family protein [Dehalococcoidia bacterium]
MVRLKDLPAEYAAHLLSLPIADYGPSPWAEAPDLKQARVAIISTAGLHRESDAKFAGGADDYRLIPGDLDYSELTMSHVSVDFDRSGFQQDPNVLFPLELLRKLEANGEIGSAASWHYSFMGATDPTRMDETAGQVAKLLKEDSVTAAILIPV